MFSFLQVTRQHGRAEYKPFTVCAKDKGGDKKETEKNREAYCSCSSSVFAAKRKKEKERQPEAKQRVKIGLKFIRRAQKERFSASGSPFEKRQRLANKFAEAISSGFCRRRHLVS